MLCDLIDQLLHLLWVSFTIIKTHIQETAVHARLNVLTHNRIWELKINITTLWNAVCLTFLNMHLIYSLPCCWDMRSCDLDPKLDWTNRLYQLLDQEIFHTSWFIDSWTKLFSPYSDIVMFLCSVQVTSTAYLSFLGRNIPLLVVLPEVCYFVIFRVFFIWFKGLRADDVTSVQFMKAQVDNL